MLDRPLRALLVLLLLVGGGAAPAEGRPAGTRWILSWASAQQVPEPANALPDSRLAGSTLRQYVRLSIGGRRLRVRLSNAFGTAPLRIEAVAVGIAGEAPGSIRAGSSRTASFSGEAAVVVPAGAEMLSDPIALAVPARARLAVSIHLEEAPQRQTGHPGSRSTSFTAPGNQVSAPVLAGASAVEHWYQLSGIEVEAPASAWAIVALGDSITDGRGARTDADERWPDRLAERLQSKRSTRGVAVLNAGMGGNRLLLDGIGPNALARLDRDVLAAPGVRTLIVLEGINDLGTGTRERPLAADEHRSLVAGIVGAYRQVVERGRAHGLRVVGATLPPFRGFDYYHPDEAAEADRQAINAWIRAPGHFDSVIDFDRAIRDPARPDRLLPAFDSGDHIHPSPAGYAAMAAAVPIEALGAPR